jgi:hypothetical protein
MHTENLGCDDSAAAQWRATAGLWGKLDQSAACRLITLRTYISNKPKNYTKDRSVRKPYALIKFYQN